MTQRKVIVRGATNQALDELDATDIPDLSASYEAAGATSAHTGDTSDAHDASAISFNPAGTIAATDVQAAIEEVAAEASGASFATPAIVLGTAAAAGAASTVIRSDSTIVAFDATAPTTQAFGDAAAAGSAAVSARRDHKHAMMTDPTAALTGLDFLVGTATGALSAEIAVGTTPGGELGGTWAAPTVDPNHAGEYVLMGGDITIADTYTTIASQAITLAAGKGLLIECSGLVLNNSGGARTYTIALDIGGTLVEISDGATVGASATNHSPLDFLGGISVQSSSLTYLWARSIRFGPSAANSATTMAGLSSIRGTWNSSASDFTGAQTIIVKIKSSAVTATQTFHRMVTRIRLV